MRAESDSGQSLQHRLRLLFRDSAEQIGGVVGIELLDEPAEIVGGHGVEDLDARGWGNASDDGCGDGRFEQREDLPARVGPRQRVQQLGEIGRVQRRHRCGNRLRARLFDECDQRFDTINRRRTLRCLSAHDRPSGLRVVRNCSAIWV